MRLPVYLIACLLLIPSAHAQSTITLQEALSQALESNPDFIANARDVGIAEAGIEQAKLIPNPELETLVEGVRDDKRTTTVQLNQLIELGGKRSSRINAAERDHDAASAELAIRRADLRASVMSAYFDVLTAQERIQLADASYQLAKQVTDAIGRRVLAGRISPIEETKTKVAELTIKAELNQANVELTVAKTRLAAMWGDVVPKFEQVDKIEPEKMMATYDDWSALQSQLASSPQLRRAQLEIDRQQAQTEVERSRRIGDLTVSIGKKREQEFGSNLTVVGISVPLPLFDRNQGNVLGALRKTDKARDEFIATERRLNTELSQAYQQHMSTHSELVILQKEILPNAEKALEATIKGFEFGKFNSLDVIEAQRTLFQTKRQYLQVQAASYKSIVDIERIISTYQ